MNKYEVLYVIDATVAEDQIAASVQKYEDLVKQHKGEVLNVDKWGKRTLAYPIDYKTEGFYVLMDFMAEPDFPSEMERVMKISEDIIRYMVVRKEDKKPQE